MGGLLPLAGTTPDAWLWRYPRRVAKSALVLEAATAVWAIRPARLA